MLQHGTFLVPTIYIGEYFLELPDTTLEKMTDGGWQAQAATRVGAEVLGWSDRLGTLEAGKLADVIAVKGDPLQDLDLLSRVDFVMLGGRVVLPREEN